MLVGFTLAYIFVAATLNYVLARRIDVTEMGNFLAALFWVITVPLFLLWILISFIPNKLVNQAPNGQ